MTVKILDNTVIAASLSEIKSVDLIDACSKHYALCTSEAVYEETKVGRKEEAVSGAYRNIEVREYKGKKFNELLRWLKERYPYLHEGELTAFLIAVLDFELKGKMYYYVTDDGRMRKTISRLRNDAALVSMLGREIKAFKLTGTIGLLAHLHSKGLISKDEIERIIVDLQNSTFRVTPELIEVLRSSGEDEACSKD